MQDISAKNNKLQTSPAMRQVAHLMQFWHDRDAISISSQIPECRLEKRTVD